jgi:choline dehydrogenase-like flavoprotein
VIYDARREVPAPTEYDLCIVGAGAAGISIALELASLPIRICLLEAGGLKYDPASQALMSGEVSSSQYPPLRGTRLAALGGTTGVWAGWCRPLESFDFAAPGAPPEQVWPVGRDELQPYYQRAHEVCGIGAFEYDVQYWQQVCGDCGVITDLEEFTNAIFHVHRQRFAHCYKEQLQQSEAVNLMLHAPVMKLNLDESGRRVGSVDVSTLQGTTTRIRATQFVLAAGGIENARLLLLSGRSPAAVPGNQYGLVGRYFSDHPFVDPGSMVFREGPGLVDFYLPKVDPTASGKSSVRGVLVPRRAVLERAGIANAALFFHPRYENHDAFLTEEVTSLLKWWAKLRRRAIPGDHWSDARRALLAPRRIVEALVRKAFVRNGPAQRWRLRAMFDCEARYENRICLGDERDRLGRREARVEWQLSDNDIHKMRRTIELFDKALRRSGIAHVEPAFPDEIDAWRSAAEAGRHHIGATRMHADPRHGVVDQHCQVYGTENLHIAGSSVFTTPGYANPTLTIVALALRLADRIKATIDIGSR